MSKASPNLADPFWWTRDVQFDWLKRATPMSPPTLNWSGVSTRIERLVIGSGMSMLAWLLERAVLRSVGRQ